MSKRSSKTIALGAMPAMALAFLAGCGEEETAYCVDVEDNVVENSYCDDDFDGNNGYFWAFVAGSSSSKIVKGSKIKKAASKIAASNTAALASKGGFGSKSSSGVGRSVASKSGGSSGGS